MIRIHIKDILNATGGKLLSGDPEDTVSLFQVDSRLSGPGTLFTAVTGGNSDGHLYLRKAFSQGASAALVSLPSVEGVYGPSGVSDAFRDRAVILVPDTVEALQKAGALKRSLHPVPAVGVTGSVGKTTSREMISYALSAEKKVFTTGKNYNNRIGVPLTLSEITEEHEIAVLELGMNVPGELGTISQLTDLDSALITNVGVAHIEYYGTKDAIAKEKFTVTKGFTSGRPEEKMLFLNHDDPLLMKYRDLTGFPYTTFGLQEGADYRASGISSDEGGRTVFTLEKHGKSLLRVRLSVLGSHNVMNAVAAMAVADRYGVDLQKAAETLGTFTGFKGRLERIEKDGILYIDDTYNASPVSMMAGLRVLSGILPKGSSGRRIAVLGDMFELGEKSRHYHEEVGRMAAALEIDKLFLRGENAFHLGEAYQKEGGKAEVVYASSNEELIALLRETLQPGDAAYFKASHGMDFQVVTDGLLQR